VGDVDLHAGEVGDACIREDADLRIEVIGGIGRRVGGSEEGLGRAVLCEGQIVRAICGEVDRLDAVDCILGYRSICSIARLEF